jgi:hypothetical protein
VFVLPSVQIWVPSLQAPQGLLVTPLMHWQPSLAGPVQLSLFPEAQVSAAAGVMLHAPQAPFAPQAWVPLAHLPTRPPAAQVRVAPSMQVQPSFGVPLQLSSLPDLQVSFAAGVTLHPPQMPALVHACFPAAQLPRAPASEHGRVMLAANLFESRGPPRQRP